MIVLVKICFLGVLFWFRRVDIFVGSEIFFCFRVVILGRRFFMFFVC